MANQDDRSESRSRELESAFRGANSLVFLLVFLVFTILPIVWLAEKMTGWVQMAGLVLLSLFTAFVLMLFVSGIIKLILKQVFMLLSKEYRDFFETQQQKQAD